MMIPTAPCATTCNTLVTNVQFPIDGFSKSCLLRGTDELGYILSFDEQIRAYENRA